MAAARAGVLGVRWLQRASRNMVPMGARTGPRERARPQCGRGVPEVWYVGRRVGIVDTAAGESGQGQRWSWCIQKNRWRVCSSLEASGSGVCSHRSLKPSEWKEEWGRFWRALICSPASHITKDMLPGPYPRTPEERAAAAKKYNMRVEDYEPYPDDGMGWDRVCSHLGSDGRSSAGLGSSTLTLFPEPFRDPSESTVWALFSVEGGGRGWVSSCSREDFNFLLGSGCFLKWRSWGFNSSLEDPWIAGTFFGSIQSARFHLDWASAGLRCCHPGTWPGLSWIPVMRTVFVDGVLYIMYISLLRNILLLALWKS